jgi:hypothetical protein
MKSTILFRHLVFFLLSLFYLPSIVSASNAQSGIKNLLIKLDKNYYYPQQKGLTSLVADLLWEQQDTSSEQIKFFNKPDFQFKGELKNHVYEKKIVPSAKNLNLSDAKKTEYINILNNYLDAFLPILFMKNFQTMKAK